jgi:hypothetical protein
MQTAGDLAIHGGQTLIGVTSLSLVALLGIRVIVNDAIYVKAGQIGPIKGHRVCRYSDLFIYYCC